VNRRPGVNWVWLARVDSTNTLAERLMEAWLADVETPMPPTLICADSQWAGRGRGDRRWQSPPGGLYASYLSWVETTALSWLPLAAGVALREGVQRLMPQLSVRLKWPNDLLVEGRKLGGILCVSRVQGARAWTVTGFGLNVLHQPELLPAERPAVSLKELGFSGSLQEARQVILDGFLAAFPTLQQNAARTRELWLAASAHAPGEQLTVRTASGLLQGAFAGLSPEGRLLLHVEQELLLLSSSELV